jgi:plastocyanin
MRIPGVEMANESVGSKNSDMLACLVGAGLLLATAAIHLDLYLTGYHLIPTIGWLFLLQVISAFGLGVAAAAVGLIGWLGAREVRGISMQQLVAGSGALFGLATLAGYLLSLAVGLLGFKEVRTTAGIVAGGIEIATFLVLGWVATRTLRRSASKGVVLAPLAIAAIVLLIVGESSAVVASSSTTTTSPSGRGHEITIVLKNFAFHPSNPRATPGERILVKNEDSVPHTFSTRPGAPAKDAFTTGAIASGTSRTVTAPDAPGTYPFLCLIHTFMTGTLTVTASG